MKLPQAPWQDSDGMESLLAALGADQGSTRYVGGYVRDVLLGVPVSDVDLATRLQPQEVLDRLQRAGIKSVPTGIAHGTITAVLKGRPVEITTLRRDISTDGRRATVAFTEDWQEDAARRDFTINALSADPATRTLFDYFGGSADLKAGLVRFIGDPIQRIAEDHLRILRFFRFHARFGLGEPDQAAIEACAARANDLMALSRERIADELLKLLAVPKPFPAMALMVTLGVLRPVLPEINAMGLERLETLLSREITFGVPLDAGRRLAALLPADAEVAASLGARLRLSKRMIKRLAVAADRGDELPGDSRILAYHVGMESAVDRLLLAGDEAGLGDRLAALKGWHKPRLPIGGADLIALGVTPGPDVSRILQAVEAEWAASGFSADKAAVKTHAQRHVDQLLRSSQ